MTDFLISFGLWAGAWLAATAALTLAGLAGLRPVWLLTALLLYAAYFVVLILGSELIPLSDYFGKLEWNWGGKIATIGLSVLVALLLGRTTQAVRPSAAGLTLRQAPGSVPPALIAATLLVATGVGLEVYLNDGPDLSPERMLYQATMPGIDEELFFRGVFLAVMAAAAPSQRLSILGAPIGWAGALVTLLFGLGHGFSYEGGALKADWFAFAATAWLGFGLLWIRERTGSILLPVLAHNAINVALSFF